jgi:hypothetical protein
MYSSNPLFSQKISLFCGPRAQKRFLIPLNLFPNIEKEAALRTRTQVENRIPYSLILPSPRSYYSLIFMIPFVKLSIVNCHSFLFLFYS